MNAVIFACSSLEKHVSLAQERMNTRYPVYFLDRKYHASPAEMRQQIISALNALAADVDTVLAAMGFCGGSWGDIHTDKRIVIPYVDDCVTLLLHTGDEPCPNLKKPGHFYFREPDQGAQSLEAMRQRLCVRLGDGQGGALFEKWFQSYTHIDIVDTGTYDSYAAAHLQQVQRDASLAGCRVEHVPGSNLLLEKLVSGRWDGQFIIAEPGQALSYQDFMERGGNHRAD